MRTDPYRVAVWSTGGVGSNAIRGIARRPDLELVGVWVYTPAKVGRDAGELAGVAPLGIVATEDGDALIGLEPDCVVYAASGPERGAGGASLYASGIFPGFASDELALLLTTQSRNIRTLRLLEVSLNDHYPVANVMMDGLGFARSLDFEPLISLPGVIPMVWQAPIALIASGPDIECRLTLGPPEGHDAGEAAMTATAMPVVNAVPYVVEAAPGLLSSLDLPVTVPMQVFA